MTLSPRRHALASLVLGALAATGQAPLGWSLLALLAFAGMAWILPRTKRPARAGWFFGLAYFATALHWIVEPFLVDPETYGWMAPFALLFMCGGLALFWGLAGWLSARLNGGKGGTADPLIWALALSALEMARGYVFTGFPWAAPGYLLLDTGYAQMASVVGVYGLTTLVLVFAALPAKILMSQGAARAGLLGLGALILASPLSQIELLPTPAEGPATQQPMPLIRLVQPSVAQEEKWDPTLRDKHFERLLTLTAAPSAQGVPDVIIWPESSVTIWLDLAEEEMRRMQEAAGEAEVIFGVQSYVAGRYFNSLATLVPSSPMPQHVYNKSHLVPFGEYTPFFGLLRRFDVFGLTERSGGGFSPGEGARVLTLPKLGAFQPLICYEGLFPQFVNRAPVRPDLMVLITNDGWFGDWAGPHQHLAKARMRSIEQALPMLRGDNIGISAVIDAKGALVAQMGLGAEGVLDARLPPPSPATLYSRIGDAPLAVLLSVVLFGAGARAGRGLIDPPAEGV
ncbi:MAG: apolipoprotein N-acyltransferase [Pseudomonadota bacterium]